MINMSGDQSKNTPDKRRWIAEQRSFLYGYDTFSLEPITPSRTASCKAGHCLVHVHLSEPQQIDVLVEWPANGSSQLVSGTTGVGVA